MFTLLVFLLGLFVGWFIFTYKAKLTALFGKLKLKLERKLTDLENELDK